MAVTEMECVIGKLGMVCRQGGASAERMTNALRVLDG